MSSWSTVCSAWLARERYHPLHERSRLLDLRCGSGLRDNFHPRARDRRAVSFDILRADQPVAPAADQQGWQFEPTEPIAQLGIMHVRLPAIERERLAVARDYPELLVGHCSIVDRGLLRIVVD